MRYIHLLPLATFSISSFFLMRHLTKNTLDTSHKQITLRLSEETVHPMMNTECEQPKQCHGTCVSKRRANVSVSKYIEFGPHPSA